MTAAETRMDIGRLESVRILCISETGWFDDATLVGDVKAVGGMEVSQYRLPWPPFGKLHAENAGGSSALIEAELTDGMVRRVLFDTGWGPAWMERLVRRLGEFGLTRLGCNHCTGERAVQAMVDAGLPVVRGTARHGSRTDLFLGNGDRLRL